MPEDIIETKRLMLRPLEESDLYDMHAMLSNPVVMRHIAKGSVFDLEQSRNVVKAAIQHRKRHGFGIMSVEEKESGTFIGWGGLIRYAYDDNAKDIEVLYSLLPDHWGKGYATEIASCLVDWGFKHLPVEYLVAVADADNAGSRNVMVKIGMHYIDERPYRTQMKMYYRIDRKRVYAPAKPVAHRKS